MNTSTFSDVPTLIAEVNMTWPDDMRVHLDGQKIMCADGHPLADELNAASSNHNFCLPYFTKTDICWFNVAKDGEDIRAAIRSLRAWIVPSYGWEDPRGFVATRDDANTPIATLLANLSPPGYLRWRSDKKDFSIIARKLKQIRQLEKAKPNLTMLGPPPLIQIRQQFVSALVVGNREAAEDAVCIIDRYQLDTADNALFMKIRLWYRFGEFSEIIKQFDLQFLSTLAVPHKLNVCVLHAFHDVYLAGLDWKEDSGAILSAYKVHIHDRIGRFIRNSRGNLGIEGTRLKVCYAITAGDNELARELNDTPDAGALSDQLRECFRSLPPADPEELFFRARAERDWLRFQALGCAFLRQGKNDYQSLLRRSLTFRANAELEELLPKDTREVETKSVFTSPQNWLDWLSAVSEDSDVDYESFLNDREEFDCDSLGIQDIERLTTLLEDIYGNTNFANESIARVRLLTGLPEFMQDVVNEPSYPRDVLSRLYFSLFLIWSELKCGSSHEPDAQILLTLAEGVLRFQRDEEQAIVDQLLKWWETSPVKALLPFLLGSVDVLNELGTKEQCGSFWIIGAEYLKRNPTQITNGERTLWRQIGAQFFDITEIDEYIPLLEDTSRDDPIKMAKLKKVAIVSLREEQAKKAAEMIKERSGADVVIVTKKVAESVTSNAATADVVLFVWQAASHAVYRAFDAMDKKTRFAYVQGTGASSIMLALERWVTNLNLP